MADLRSPSQTSNRVRFKLTNSATGAGLTGLTLSSTGLIISTICDNESSATVYTQAGSTIETITTLGTFDAPTATKCRFKEVDATNHPGIYELQFADARFSVANAQRMIVSLPAVAGLSLAGADYEIQLIAPPNLALLSINSSGRVDIGKWLGTAVVLAGGSQLPSVNIAAVSDDPTAAGNVATFADDYNGGNLATNITGNLIGNVTGNVNGTVVGGVTVSQMNAGVIQEGVIAEDAIDALSFKQDAADKIGNSTNVILSAAHGSGLWACGGTGGFNAITIHVTDGVTGVQNALVNIYNGNILIKSGLTDASGNLAASADDGTYTVVAQANGYQNYSGSITVSGTGTFTVTLTAVSPISPPADPELCTIAGYIFNTQGLPAEGVVVTATPVSSKPVTGPVVTTTGAVFSFNPVSVASDSDGLVTFDVTRTDVLSSLAVTYTIEAANGQINRTGVRLGGSTLNLNTL